MAVNDVYQMTVSATGQGSLYQNTFAVMCVEATEPVLADFTTLAIDFKELHRPQQSGAIAYTTWRARQVRGTSVTWPNTGPCAPVGGRYEEGNFTSSTTGGGVGVEMLPPQCALVTTLRTGQIGRRKRGRLYAYGYNEDLQTSGVWAASLITAQEARLATWFDKYGTPDPGTIFRLGVWSFRTASGCVPNEAEGGHIRIDTPNPDAAFTPLTGYLLRTTVYTQRRRTRGVGR